MPFLISAVPSFAGRLGSAAGLGLLVEPPLPPLHLGRLGSRRQSTSGSLAGAGAEPPLELPPLEPPELPPLEPPLVVEGFLVVVFLGLGLVGSASSPVSPSPSVSPASASSSSSLASFSSSLPLSSSSFSF